MPEPPLEPIEVGGDEAPAGRVEGADVRFDGAAFHVVATLDGSLISGTLSRGWRLDLDPASIVYPLLPWQSSGLADPDFVVGTDGEWVVFAAADGTAIGAAKRVTGVLSVDNVVVVGTSTSQTLSVFLIDDAGDLTEAEGSPIEVTAEIARMAISN